MDGEGGGEPEVEEEAPTRGGEGGQVWTHWLVTWGRGNGLGKRLSSPVMNCQRFLPENLGWPDPPVSIPAPYPQDGLL